MPQTGDVVGHGVSSTGNVVVAHVIAMVAKTREAEEIGGRIAGSDVAFGDAADGGGVIIEKGKSAFAGINCPQAMLHKDAREYDCPPHQGSQNGASCCTLTYTWYCSIGSSIVVPFKKF
jgi:hypothetical protein